MKSNIRKLRNERNISQTKLAEVLGKTQQTISHMERDRDRIPIESLITLSEYFGVSTDYILGIEPEEDKNDESKNRSSPDREKPKDEALNLRDNNNGENKKILYQLILSLLLYSLEDDTMQTNTAQQ